MDFEAMSQEELEQFSISSKQQIEELREQRRQARDVYVRREHEKMAADMLKAHGLEHVIVRPQPAVLKLKGN